MKSERGIWKKQKQWSYVLFVVFLLLIAAYFVLPYSKGVTFALLIIALILFIIGVAMVKWHTKKGFDAVIDSASEIKKKDKKNMVMR